MAISVRGYGMAAQSSRCEAVIAILSYLTIPFPQAISINLVASGGIVDAGSKVMDQGKVPAVTWIV